MRMEADVWPHGTRGAKGSSAPPRSRRRVRWRWILLGVVVLFLVTRVVAVIIVSAEDDPPPVTDNFIDGPNYGKDVVHVRGADGPKLQWDLDGDGKIRREERTITEQELYAATLWWRRKRP